MQEPLIAGGRRARRRGRGLQIGAIVAGIAIVAVVLVMVLGGGEDSEAPGKIAFRARTVGIEQGPGEIPGGAAKEEGRTITRMLNDWYLRAFVDPALYGDGTYPEVREMFEPAAQAKFDGDVNVLTIGESRELVSRVDPTTATVGLTIYFDDQGRPAFAVADVDFRATAQLTQAGGDPVEIVQDAVLHLRRGQDGKWLVFAWDADQKQDSVNAEATPT